MKQALLQAKDGRKRILGIFFVYKYGGYGNFDIVALFSTSFLVEIPRSILC